MTPSVPQYSLPNANSTSSSGFISIKFKLLGIIAGILVGITILNVWLASSLIHRQHQEEAYERLNLQLTVFQKDLEAMHARFMNTVLETIKAEKTLQNFSLIYSQQLSADQRVGYCRMCPTGR